MKSSSLIALLKASDEVRNKFIEILESSTAFGMARAEEIPVKLYTGMNDEGVENILEMMLGSFSNNEALYIEVDELHRICLL